MDFKGTKGNWEYTYNTMLGTHVRSSKDGTCICTMSQESNAFEADENAKLISQAPELLRIAREARKCISSLKLSMLASPECEEGSEFDDLTSYAENMERRITEIINNCIL